MREYKDSSYAYYKNHNICVRCKKTKVTEGKALCDECARKSREYKKLLRKSMKKMGLCIDCGMKKEPERAEMCCCVRCAEKRRIRQNKRYHEGKDNEK